MEKNQGGIHIFKQKRQDLQGIRGIAIISVLGFHFLPKSFPNGYIGVDQFFVLSGFLMCMLLRKSYHSPQFVSTFQWMFKFYFRRLKRIIPLYLLLIFISLLALFSIFPYNAWDQSVISGRRALIFRSNRDGLMYGDYFALLSSATDIFTHTWSLSVEVQFYALVPFLYLFGAIMFRSRGKLELLYFTVLGSLSFYYSTTLPEQKAFHSVPARVWQFTVGIIAYLIENLNPPDYQLLSEDPKQKFRNNWKSLLPTLLIMAGLYPSMEWPDDIFRPFITILTGIVIVLESFDTEPESKNLILESRILTYFGDISYSLYLIHWPIYSYWKLVYSDEKDYNPDLFVAIGSSIVLAILSYEIIEKWYLARSKKSIIFLCFTLFCLNSGLLYKEELINWVAPPPFSTRLDGLTEGELVNYTKAKKLNLMWTVHDRINLGAPTCEYEEPDGILGNCRHTGLNSSGKYKLMLIGNSWAANHARLFYEECSHQANTIIQQAMSGCEPLYAPCTNEKDYFVKMVEKEKPDYLFIVSRFMDVGGPFPPNVTKIDNDPTYQNMKSQLEIFLKHVKNKIFMMHQIATKRRTFDLQEHPITEKVRDKKDLVEFDNFLTNKSPNMARLRYNKLASECPKCQLFDYKPYFFNSTTQTWRFYDEKNAGLSYINGMVHLTYHGLELIRPVIRNICRSL